MGLDVELYKLGAVMFAPVRHWLLCAPLPDIRGFPESRATAHPEMSPPDRFAESRCDGRWVTVPRFTLTLDDFVYEAQNLDKSIQYT